MTGRRLYDHFTDALAMYPSRGWTGEQLPETPKAWAFLNHNERRVWNTAARAASGARRKAKA